MQSKKCIHLTLTDDLVPECLRDEWCVEFHPRESRILTFWDTFEWGVWFNGHVLYSCNDIYYLCTRDKGCLRPVLYEEQSSCRRRFWKEFETEPMRAQLEGMLGLRGLEPVVEGTFSLRQCDVSNAMGKIVCRLECVSVSTGKRGEEKLLHSCQVMPLLGYEAEGELVVKLLTERGARTSEVDLLEVLLQHANLVPRKYTLRPVFGLEKDTPAREAIGRIVRAILDIAISNIPGILSDIDTEFLHDYRICLRKIRSVLSLVKDVYPAEETQRVRKILGNLARQTNRLRDLDVYLLARDEYLKLLPPGLRPALDKMFEDFSAEREREVQRVVLKMSGSTSRRLLREIERFFLEETSHKPSPTSDLPVGPLAFRRIYKCYRKIRKIAAVIGTETPDEAVHQLRIECKKLRYLMEFFSELFPKEEGAAIQSRRVVLYQVAINK